MTCIRQCVATHVRTAYALTRFTSRLAYKRVEHPARDTCSRALIRNMDARSPRLLSTVAHAWCYVAKLHQATCPYGTTAYRALPCFLFWRDEFVVSAHVAVVRSFRERESC